MSVTLTVNDNLPNNVKSMEAYIDIELDKAIVIISDRLQSTARNDHVYHNRTGNLQRSTVFDPNKLNNSIRGYVKSSAPYGDKVIQRTGDDFINKAIITNQTFIDSVIDNAINVGVEKWLKEL